MLDGNLRATAALINSLPWWPAVAALAIWLLRANIGGVLDRVRKYKFGGQEVELDATVQAFERSIQEEVSRLAEQPEAPAQEAQSPRTTPNQMASDEASVLELASRDPRIGILALGSLIERDTRVLASQLGIEGSSTRPWQSLIESLSQRGSLGGSMPSTARLFSELRNQVVHGVTVPRQQDLAVALDSGLTMLRVLRTVPHETYIVKDVVPVYDDPLGKNEMKGVRGVLLSVASPGGTRQEDRIYPTTRSYEPGSSVSWAWDGTRIYGPAWYRPAPGHSVQKAWDGSAEFAGTPLEGANRGQGDPVESA